VRVCQTTKNVAALFHGAFQRLSTLGPMLFIFVSAFNDSTITRAKHTDCYIPGMDV